VDTRDTGGGGGTSPIVPNAPLAEDPYAGVGSYESMNMTVGGNAPSGGWNIGPYAGGGENVYTGGQHLNVDPLEDFVAGLRVLSGGGSENFQ